MSFLKRRLHFVQEACLDTICQRPNGPQHYRLHQTNHWQVSSWPNKNNLSNSCLRLTWRQRKWLRAGAFKIRIRFKRNSDIPYTLPFCSNWCSKHSTLSLRNWNQKNITQDYVWFSRRFSFYLREKCQGMWQVAVMPPSIKTRVGWDSREGFNARQGRQTHTQLARAWTNK